MKIFLVTLSVLILAGVGMPSVLAHDDRAPVPEANGHSHGLSRVSGPSDRVETVTQNKTSPAKDAANNQNKEMERCKKRQASISRIMLNLVDLGEKQLVVFDDISQRAQNFYVKQELNNEGYETALASVTAARGEVVIRLEDMRNTQAEFSCDVLNPGLKVNIFQEHLHSLVDALKAYRATIRDLIVNIRTTAEKNQNVSVGQNFIEPEPNQAEGAGDE